MKNKNSLIWVLLTLIAMVFVAYLFVENKGSIKNISSLINDSVIQVGG